MNLCHECKMHFLTFDNTRETFFKRFLNVHIIDSTLKRALLLIKIISFGMKTHGYYTKCNTNVRREVNPEGVKVKEGDSQEGRIPCIYIQGNGASCAKKVGTGLARQR